MNKSRGRPFEPGNQVGRGRPKGSRNLELPPEQSLFADYRDYLTRKCIGSAMQGDRSAMRLCMERASPVQPVAWVPIRLPKIETAWDVNQAADKVTREVGRGKITPAEARSLMSILETHLRIIAKVQWERRLEILEAADIAAENEEGPGGSEDDNK